MNSLSSDRDAKAMTKGIVVKGFLKRLWHSGVIGTFLTGLVVLTPLILTLAILQWIMARLAGAFGPGTWAGDLLASAGAAVVGPNHGAVAFLLGFAAVLAGIWALGVLVRGRLRTGFESWLDGILSRVPLLRLIYGPVAQVVRLLAGDGKSEIKAMRVVMVRFGGPGGADVLALQASPQVYVMADGDRRLMVYLPTSPIPMSGGLVLVPEANVAPVPGMTADDLLRIYVSLGALSPASADAFTGPTLPQDLAKP